MKKISAMILVMIVVLGMTVSAAGTGSSEKPVLKLKNISVETLKSNEEAELTVTLANVGNTSAYDGSFSLDIPESTPLKVTDQILYQQLDYAYINQEVDVTFNVYTESGAAAGTYELSVSGTYYDEDNNIYNFTESFTVDIEEGKEDVDLDISVSEGLVLSAGEENTITVEVNNQGSGNAWALQLDLVNNNQLYMTETVNNYHSTLQSSETVTFEYIVMVSGDVNGYTPVEFEATYLTGKEEVNRTYEAYVNVGEEASGDVIISSVSKNKSTIYPDGQVTFDIVLENIGSNTVEEVKIEISQDPGLVPASQSIIKINSLGSGETENLSFVMEATDSATSKNYPVEFTVTYGSETVTQYSGVNISNDEEDEEEDDVTKPRIIISEFSISNDKIFLGDTFDMAFTVMNTSLLKDVRNLKVVLETSTGQTSESVFLPLNQSNSYFVSSLGMEETAEILIPLKVFANAEGKSYSLNIDFEYEDYDGNFYTDTETISIPIYEKTELTVSDVRIGNTLDNGYTLEVDFYNTGKVDITNMMVDIEGDFVTNNSNYYVGDFTTGRTDVYDVEISGTRPDYIVGEIIFTYDDTFGEEETYVKAFTIGDNTEASTGGATGVKGQTGEGTAMAAGGDLAGGAAGKRAGGNGQLPEMTEEQMAQFQNMSKEERIAFMQNGGFENTGASVGGLFSDPLVLYGAIGGGLVIVIAVVAVVVRRKRKAA